MTPMTCFKFRLYLAGNTPNSTLAKTNLGALCRDLLPGRYKIEIVDVLKNPNRALTEGILMTPCLLKLSPSPVRMVVGTLVRSGALLNALGLAEEDELLPAASA
jgi:circadian clock protein KaiB